jgi:twitching motility protein PilT
VGAIERLTAVFPAGEQDSMRRQLSLVLRAVVAQHLLAATGPAPGRAGSGTARVPASEILVVTPAVANLIATGRSVQIYSAMETGAAAGMQTLEQDLARLWAAGRIGETAALAMARSPAAVRDLVAACRRTATARGGPHGR